MQHQPKANRRRGSATGAPRIARLRSSDGSRSWSSLCSPAAAIGTQQLDRCRGMPASRAAPRRALTDSGLAPAGEQVLVHSDGMTVDDPAFTAAIEDVTDSLGPG